MALVRNGPSYAFLTLTKVQVSWASERDFYGRRTSARETFWDVTVLP
jgi:hypothetical protein